MVKYNLKKIKKCISVISLIMIMSFAMGCGSSGSSKPDNAAKEEELEKTDNDTVKAEDMVDGAVQISINSNKAFQKIRGFGAGFTYYSNYLYYNKYKEEVYDLLFKDLNLTILRFKNAYKYDAEKLILNKTDFNIYELTKLVYDELKPLADSKNIEFSIDCENKELEVQADRSELRRVICNLCGNAISYTPEGGKVVITLKNESNDLIFSVSDNGCGIPQEDIPNMFQRFSQGTSKKRSAGTGLGLYLSRQIIESHGGKIWLESAVNKGSEFSFILTDAISSAGVLK